MEGKEGRMGHVGFGEQEKSGVAAVRKLRRAQGTWVQSPANHLTIQTDLNPPETGELLLQRGPMSVSRSSVFLLNMHT